MPRNPRRAGGPRSLRVGEAMRHALAELLARGDHLDAVLSGASITVTEVRMSPDLRQATAYVLPLGGAAGEAVLAGLQRAAAGLRMRLGRLVPLRFSPALHFELDRRFDQAERLAALLRGDRSPGSPHG